MCISRHLKQKLLNLHYQSWIPASPESWAWADFIASHPLEICLFINKKHHHYLRWGKEPLPQKRGCHRSAVLLLASVWPLVLIWLWLMLTPTVTDKRGLFWKWRERDHRAPREHSSEESRVSRCSNADIALVVGRVLFSPTLIFPRCSYFFFFK